MYILITTLFKFEIFVLGIDHRLKKDMYKFQYFILQNIKLTSLKVNSSTLHAIMIVCTIVHHENVYLSLFEITHTPKKKIH